MKRTYQPSKVRRARTHGFLGAHEDPRRPRRDQRAPRQGPQAPRPVARLPRRRRMIGRILRNVDFERVLRRAALFAECSLRGPLPALRVRATAGRAPTSQTTELSTGDAPNLTQPVDNAAVPAHWLGGTVIPKRHARTVGHAQHAATPDACGHASGTWRGLRPRAVAGASAPAIRPRRAFRLGRFACALASSMAAAASRRAAARPPRCVERGA